MSDNLRYELGAGFTAWLLALAHIVEDSTIMPVFEMSHRDGAHIPATAAALILERLAPVCKWPACDTTDSIPMESLLMRLKAAISNCPEQTGS